MRVSLKLGGAKKSEIRAAFKNPCNKIQVLIVKFFGVRGSNRMKKDYDGPLYAPWWKVMEGKEKIQKSETR